MEVQTMRLASKKIRSAAKTKSFYFIVKIKDDLLGANPYSRLTEFAR